jgi:CRP-like cAMP-binding protein
VGQARLADGRAASLKQHRPMAIVALYRGDARHPQAQACAACEVRSQALFGALDDEGLDRIHTRIASLELAPDEPVFGRGDAGQAVFTLRSGIVRFERSTEHGDRRIVRLAGRGDLIGQEALLQRPYADEAIACTPVRLCRLPRHLVDELAASTGNLPRELMHRWQSALDAAESWVADLSTGPARRRLLRLLERLTALTEPGQAVWLPRRDEIGAMLDITVETASRMISQLRRESVLALSGQRHATVDRSALARALRVDAG